MKIAGYGRVSSMGQLDGTSLEDQRKRIEERAARDEHELVDLYFDGGVSGGSLDRPELQRLREDAAKGKFEGILFTKLDRMGRSLRDIANLFHEFEQLGISLICLDDPGLNTSGKMGKVMRGILSSFAEFEKDMISERTSAGRAARWASGGMPLGDNHLPLGYRKNEKTGKPEIVESEAAIYRQIISLYMDSRLSMKEIALQLTREGTPSPSAIKKVHLDSQRKTKRPNSVKIRKRPAASRWNNTSVSNILKNSAYKGEALYNKAVYDLRKGGSKGSYKRIGKDEKPSGEWIKIPFPPLISEALWEQIQSRIKTQVHKPKRIYKGYEENFLLDGLIYCGECGGRMRKQVQILKSGKALLHYTCFWQSCGSMNRELSGREKCIFKPIEAESTDAAIYLQVIDLLTRPETFVKTWLKDLDAEALSEKVANLERQEKILTAQLTTGFNLHNTAINDDLRKLYLAELRKTEHQWKTLQPDLKIARQEAALILSKVDRFKLFVEAMKTSDRAGKMSLVFSQAAKFKRFLLRLPFGEKRKIVEAIVSPETGGRCWAAYTRPIDFLDDEELKSIQKDKRHEPLTDRKPTIYVEFSLDINRLEVVITSLDRRVLLKQSNPT